MLLLLPFNNLINSTPALMQEDITRSNQVINSVQTINNNLVDTSTVLTDVTKASIGEMLIDIARQQRANIDLTKVFKKTLKLNQANYDSLIAPGKTITDADAISYFNILIQSPELIDKIKQAMPVYLTVMPGISPDKIDYFNSLFIGNDATQSLHSQDHVIKMRAAEICTTSIQAQAKQMSGFTSATLADIRREIKKLNKVKDAIQTQGVPSADDVITLEATDQKMAELTAMRDLITQNISPDKVTLDWSETNTTLGQYTSDIVKRKDLHPTVDAIIKSSTATQITQNSNKHGETVAVGLKLASDEIEVLTKNFAKPGDPERLSVITQEADGTVKDESNQKERFSKPEKIEKGIAMAVKALEAYQPNKPLIISGNDGTQCMAAHAMMIFLMHDAKGNILPIFKDKIETIKNYGLGTSSPTKGMMGMGSYMPWVQAQLNTDANNPNLVEMREKLHKHLLTSSEQTNFLGFKNTIFELREQKKQTADATVSLPGRNGPGN